MVKMMLLYVDDPEVMETRLKARPTELEKAYISAVETINYLCAHIKELEESAPHQ